MKRLLLALCLMMAAPLYAQEAQRIDLRAERSGGASVALSLEAIVPWRIFTLADPMRVIVDFKGLSGRVPPINGAASALKGVRFGALDQEWSRLVIDLAQPLRVKQAQMQAQGEGAALRLELASSDEEAFRASAGAPEGWQMVPSAAPPPRARPEIPLVVIDPGHGGIDPGAIRDGVVEGELMLSLAKELAQALEATGEFETLLTRSVDVFVPLTDRMSIARAAQADVFISLHADALEDATVQGASVYTLSSEALDAASAQLAERLNRADLLAGLDLSGQDDTVATVLMDMARRETGPQGERLARSIVDGWQTSGANLNSRPHRHAALWVLNAADFPSVLVEAGFLSHPQDRVRLDTVLGREPVVAGIVAGLRIWQRTERNR